MCYYYYNYYYYVLGIEEGGRPRTHERANEEDIVGYSIILY